MNRQGTVSVFKRLFGLFLLMVIVIYIVIAVIFIQYVSQQREIDMQAHENRVAGSVSVIEQQLKAIYNMELQLLQDSRAMRLASYTYSDEYERGCLILELLTHIQSTESINSAINDIIMIFPGQGIELSAQNGYDRKEYQAENTYYKYGSKSQLLVMNEARLEMNIAYPLPVSGNENYVPDYIVRIILSDTYLNNYIENLRSPNGEGAFWALCENGEWKVAAPATQSEQQLLQNPNPKYLVTRKTISDYGLTLAAYQDTGAMVWKTGRTLLYMGAIFLFMGVLFWVMISWANHSISKPIYKVIDALERVRRGDLQVRIFHNANDEFGYIYSSFNAMVSEIEELIENIREQKSLLQKAELMQLQSQINPHFLYNSFYNIKFMAQNENYEQIETFVTALAKYYRFLNKQTSQNVPLSSEVGHMENYIDIQQMRFGDKIRVEKQELPAELADFKVPKLILQPVVENAYKYGLANCLKDGLLKITYRMEEALLFMEIEDNGGAVTTEQLMQMRKQLLTYEGEAINHALTNIQRRLLLAYGEPNGVSLDIGETGGLRVTLRLDTSVCI